MIKRAQNKENKLQSVLIAITCYFPVVVLVTLGKTLDKGGAERLIRWAPRTALELLLFVIIGVTPIVNTWWALKLRPEVREKPEFYFRLIVCSLSILWLSIAILAFIQQIS